MSKSPEPWVASEEICAYLRISPDTLTHWIAAMGMPAHRVGMSLRFKVAEVDAWIRSGVAAEDRSEDKSEDKSEDEGDDQTKDQQ